MKKYWILGEQSDELTELFNRADASLAIVEGCECWLADDIDASEFPELMASPNFSKKFDATFTKIIEMFLKEIHDPTN